MNTFKVIDNAGNEVDYSDFVANLEPPVAITLDAISPMLTDQKQIFQLLHAGLGMVTETGELIDMLKKVLFAGRPRDLTNLKEELGDILWYLQLACNAGGITINDCIQANARKLNLRHGSKFNQVAASDYSSRDLKAERTLLESTAVKSSEV